ncbi:MAG TPA: MOSC N-terminal beta barrel domain-containing protein [Ilumatobacteraceae bacterium]
MHVAEIWSYPVKSMIGRRVGRAELDHLGIVGDRTWAVRDLERGGIRGAKKIGELMRLAAEPLTDGNVAITLPDGRRTVSSDDDVDEVVSDALGRKVRLEALRPADDLDHYRRGAPDSTDFVAEIRGIMGRTADEPLPDFSIFPPEIVEFESPPGTYYDAFPLMLMTTSSMRSLAAAVPDAVVDIRRFRPSMVIDTGEADGYPETGWTGRATIDAAEIEFTGMCPRCVMTTREITPDIPADGRILRHIVRELDQVLGAYARIVTPASIQVGDLFALVG